MMMRQKEAEDSALRGGHGGASPPPSPSPSPSPSPFPSPSSLPFAQLLHKQLAALSSSSSSSNGCALPFSPPQSFNPFRGLLLLLRDEMERSFSPMLPLAQPRRRQQQQQNTPAFPHHRLCCLASMSCSPPTAAAAAAPASPSHVFDIALEQEDVSRTLAGVPVYTVSNAGNEFVVVSDADASKSLSLLCFRQQDAEALLSKVRVREPTLGRETRVVTVPLDKVYKLTAEGISFRFLPDPAQIKNAIEAKVKSGEKTKSFDGVPVFQSENLILRSSDRRYIPIFFQKEDLEKALIKASRDKRSNPSLRSSMNIQVGSFEDVLKKLELNDEASGWGDFIFVPPGKDVLQHLGKALG